MTAVKAPTKLRVLVVEDEEAIRQGLADVLVYHGYEVVTEARGDVGLQTAIAGGFDLMLLDVMLPGVDGFAICAAVRKRDRAVPIIMLTAKTSDEDVVNGLALGADEYVAKPFSIRVLLARAEAVLRRSHKAELKARTIALGGVLSIDVKNLTGTWAGDAGRVEEFTRREVDLLLFLKAHRDRPVTREELLVKVWGYPEGSQIETRTVDIHIAKLRRKIEPDAKEPRFLVTVRGMGYRLDHADD
jgi:two-component system response regulator RegX3